MPSDNILDILDDILLALFSSSELDNKSYAEELKELFKQEILKQNPDSSTLHHEIDKALKALSRGDLNLSEDVCKELYKNHTDSLEDSLMNLPYSDAELVLNNTPTPNYGFVNLILQEDGFLLSETFNQLREESKIIESEIKIEETNLLVPFPSDYDEKLKVSSLDPNLEIPIVQSDHSLDINYFDARDLIADLPRILPESETPAGVGEVRISNKSRDKLVNSIKLYEDSLKLAYMRVIPHLPTLISQSVLLEEHRDRKKNESGKRLAFNESNLYINKVQRVYGCFKDCLGVYRVKTTIQVFKENTPSGVHHGYDITEIELLNPKTGSLERPLEVHQPLNSNSVEELLSPIPGVIEFPLAGNKVLNNSSIPLAKLLKDVELSYEPNVKLVDAIRACHELKVTGNSESMRRVYEEARAKRLSTQLTRPLEDTIWKAKATIKSYELDEERKRETLAFKTDSPRLLENLSKDVSPAVRELVARNPRTSAEVLENLSKDEDLGVRQAVASNPNTPPKVLERLSQDKFDSIKILVGRNPSTPSQILASLSNSSDPFIREAVASNVNTPADVLERLSKDEGFSFIQNQLAWNPSTSADVLERLSKYEDCLVRKAVASNVNTPADVLERLSEDKEDLVRMQVASSPRTSAKLLERLSKDESRMVRMRATENNRASKESKSQKNSIKPKRKGMKL